jgi:CheY-like chemotaxis protein
MGSRTILLVDDNPNDIFLAVRALRKADFKNVIVRNHGKEALEFLHSTSDGNNDSKAAPEILIVDINMPIMNGMELIRALRADPLLGQLPVIVLSSSFNPKDQNTCKELGVHTYLIKPTSPNDFKSAIAELDLPPLSKEA